MASKILIVEDEHQISRLLELELTHEGYEVETAENGREGLAKATAAEWDLILLDVMLPELNGLEVLRKLRNQTQTTPVILLTARDTTTDKVVGLDRGADDYVTKPFEMEELLARIRVCIRKRELLLAAEPESETEETELKVDDLIVHLKTREVKREGGKIELTPKEFELLAYLMQHKGQVLTREQIVSDVWRFDFMGDTNIVDVYIGYLRKKVDYEYKKQLIQTIRGVGYCIREPEEP